MSPEFSIFKECLRKEALILLNFGEIEHSLKYKRNMHIEIFTIIINRVLELLGEFYLIIKILFSLEMKEGLQLLLEKLSVKHFFFIKFIYVNRQQIFMKHFPRI